MSDRPNTGATSETAQTWKTIHTKHTLRHPNKTNMEWWWRRPNDIRGPWGPKVSWHLSYRWGKASPRKPVPTGDRTQSRCVTSAHATICSTAVDWKLMNQLNLNFVCFLFWKSRICRGGRRVLGISGSLIWSKPPMELIFNPCGEFRWSPECPVSQIHSPHLHVVLLGSFQIFQGLFRC